ncbi:unnamed protein product [Bursaphelenchus okinawaensis]|uniref:RING-type domain-containing protein n=1 Tax=Bursaphelenchus okinawaensis TaxID=465554 RepID=A0A811L3K7_9BILA|nr:unnamed protein product [Bursaphelenchus okinawaensis]CAG9118510.1 unnamed protein product [Bursaphelenchus okinawaensis]
MSSSLAQLTQVKCPICLERYAIQDSQQLSCEHRFCLTCLSLSSNLGTCPVPGCGTMRNLEVMVDEVDDNDESAGGDDDGDRHKRVLFAPNMLQLEERQRCEVVRGMFQCVNVARMTMIDCQHRVCFDCVAKSVSSADSLNDVPRCPMSRCANLLTRAEVAHVSEKVINLFPVFKRMSSKLPDITDDSKPAMKDEIRLFCSIYGANSITKSINIPKVCVLPDMINAIMQILKVDKNRTPSSIGIFIRVESEKSKIKFEYMNLKTLAKKTVKDAALTDKTHIVLDLNNELRRN